LSPKEDMAVERLRDILYYFVEDKSPELEKDGEATDGDVVITIS
jgi:hypothetical protein